ncbi:DUF2590 family protein [Salmonella enterica]|uniref:DUF2590 family protein n=1 Tax=Salmonella enterica TaxID=28901 RepID=A0A747SEU3_SALER|nr:DUF2590 family protein [Salmonella enterica]ECA7250737.1 DUF2590 family protein [Salmonella enterica subsp. enterica serovar Oranienburg]ECU9206746.1 DUF2590 family protein [Salmonella enterica subsp. enterica serovar Gatuni]EDU5438989.1 DUF2590 family protein [Salmonella enterica subsp. enterica serovar Hadar]EEE1370039.1 DUF2590 family protein [Salmonella enterica subsp. enterica serovar Durban]
MNNKSLYIDLLITDGDLTLNSASEPVLCDNSRSISQDMIHALIESGLPYRLIAENSPTLRADLFTQMVILLEEDVRLIPGTVFIDEERPGRLLITAETWDFGPLSREVSYAE